MKNIFFAYQVLRGIVTIVTRVRASISIFRILTVAFFTYAAPAFAAQSTWLNTDITQFGGDDGPNIYGNYTSGTTKYNTFTEDPNHNTLTIESIGKAMGVFGAASDTQNVSGNRVTIKGEVKEVIGGSAYRAYDAEATDNRVFIEGGVIVGGVTGGGSGSHISGRATATRNEVTMNSGASSTLFGGATRTDGAAIAQSLQNSVTMNGGTSFIVAGAFSEAVGTGDAITSGNTLTIHGGTINQYTLGGYATSDAATAFAIGNTVLITGGTMFGDIGGGYVEHSGSSTAFATGNTVTISGNPTFGNLVRLMGGFTVNSSGGDYFSSNTLNLKTAGLTVDTLQNFENLHFYLPSTLSAGQTMLTVTRIADLTDGVARSSIVKVGIDGAASPLRTGDTVILIDASSGSLITNSGLNRVANAQGLQGIALRYDFDLSIANNQLLATARELKSGNALNPQTKTLSEGYLSGLLLLKESANMIADEGIALAEKSRRGFGTFGTMAGGKSRYNTGSHVAMKSYAFLTGLSWNADTPIGALTLGAFFEYGNGAYDTYNSFMNAASVKSEGDLRHYGGGVLSRVAFLENDSRHFYVEATARAGRLKNDYVSNDLRDATGKRAAYDSSSHYLGFHAGAGYLLNLTESATLDLYSQYFWARQASDEARLSTGETVHFDKASSSRFRIGGRFSYAINERVTPYVGVAYEYEFEGSANARIFDFSIDAPSLRGSVGVGAIGIKMIPSLNAPLSVTLGLQGYVGKREGVTGAFQARLEF